LELNKWYKHALGSLANFQGVDKSSYGISVFKKHFLNQGWFIDTDFDNWTLATPEEVQTALTKEAIKRGYFRGVKVVDIYNGKSEKDTAIISSNKFDWEEIPCGEKIGQMALRDSNGSIIFHNGQWATIIKHQELTLQQIADNSKIDLNELEKIIKKSFVIKK